MRVVLFFCLIIITELSANDEFAKPIRPIPTQTKLSKIEIKKARLGEMLFSDKRLSKGNQVSCMSCHDVYSGGGDGKVTSDGINGKKGTINTPTVINSSLNFRQFWDGRAESLEEQIDGPIHHPSEMGSSWSEIELKLNKDQNYVALFRNIFNTQVTAEGIKSAIAAYERTLIATDSPFDEYLLGNESAIGPDEKIGYEKFKSFGCISCHQGINVGGNMYQTMGVARDYFKDRGNVQKSDMGLFNVTGIEEDRHVFRVPSLRNVSLTAPYFHDGSARNLPDAIKVMARYQLGREISDADVNYVAKFLRSLEGKQPRTLQNAETSK